MSEIMNSCCIIVRDSEKCPPLSFPAYFLVPNTSLTVKRKLFFVWKLGNYYIYFFFAEMKGQLTLDC